MFPLESVAQRAGLKKQSVHQFEQSASGVLLDTVARIAAACGGEIVAIMIARGDVALRQVLARVQGMSAEELNALLETYAHLPPDERALMRFTGEIRARQLTAMPPADNVRQLPRR